MYEGPIGAKFGVSAALFGLTRWVIHVTLKSYLSNAEEWLRVSCASMNTFLYYLVARTLASKPYLMSGTFAYEITANLGCLNPHAIRSLKKVFKVILQSTFWRRFSFGCPSYISSIRSLSFLPHALGCEGGWQQISVSVLCHALELTTQDLNAYCESSLSIHARYPTGHWIAERALEHRLSTHQGLPTRLRLEDVHKEAVKKFGEEPLTGAAEQRYRRVLGQLAWAALSRADLSFPISFLSRFQAKPNPAAEHCMRTFLKWLALHLHFVQRMPASQCPYAGEPKEVVSFCDASWGLDSVSGAIIIYKGCCIKFFSRKQEVPALSSAEPEIISIVETAKEMVSIGMLLQTVVQGIPLDPLGMPQQTTGDMGLNMFNDAKAAISMGKMDGLLRRVRHLELRVKYCQHLHKTRKLSITHWKGEENPADGLTKSSKPLSLRTNLVEAVGLVPGPKEQGSNWIRNYLNQIQQETNVDLDTSLALPSWHPRRG